MKIIRVNAPMTVYFSGPTIVLNPKGLKCMMGSTYFNIPFIPHYPKTAGYVHTITLVDGVYMVFDKYN